MIRPILANSFSVRVGISTHKSDDKNCTRHFLKPTIRRISDAIEESIGGSFGCDADKSSTFCINNAEQKPPEEASIVDDGGLVNAIVEKEAMLKKKNSSSTIF